MQAEKFRESDDVSKELSEVDINEDSSYKVESQFSELR